MFVFKDKYTLVSSCSKKKKIALLASSMHNYDAMDAESGNLYKPEILTRYNRTKEGVDVVDKLCANYNCARTPRRWLILVSYACLTLTGINSQVVHNSNNIENNMLRRKFLKELLTRQLFP